MSETNNESDKFKIDFGKRLRDLLNNKNGISPLGRKVTQVELANHIDKIDPPCSRQIVYRYEYGGALPDLYRVKLIADFFKVTSYDYFLCGSKATQKENIDISAKTGLDENSITLLSEIKMLMDSDLDNNKNFKQCMLIANTLLNRDNFIEFTYSINEYVKRAKRIKKTIQSFILLDKIEREFGDEKNIKDIDLELLDINPYDFEKYQSISKSEMEEYMLGFARQMEFEEWRLFETQKKFLLKVTKELIDSNLD